MVTLYWSNSKVFEQKKQAEPTGDGLIWGERRRGHVSKARGWKANRLSLHLHGSLGPEIGSQEGREKLLPQATQRNYSLWEWEQLFGRLREAHLKISHPGFRERFWIHFCLSTLQSKPLFKIKIHHCLLYLASLLCVLKCYPTLKNFVWSLKCPLWILGKIRLLHNCKRI